MVNPTSRLETVQEVRDAAATTPVKSASDMVSQDDGSRHRGNDSERVPKEMTDIPGDGTTKTVSEGLVVDEIKALNNSGEGTREACQRTDGSPRIGGERLSGDDSKQTSGVGSPDLRKPCPDGQTGGVVSPPPLGDSAIPVQRPDMSYYAWSPYHPGYMNGPVMWVPPQAPPVHHFHINIHNSNINNQVTEDPEDDADGQFSYLQYFCSMMYVCIQMAMARLRNVKIIPVSTSVCILLITRKKPAFTFSIKTTAVSRRILHGSLPEGGVRTFRQGTTFRIAKDETGACHRVFS